MADNPNTPPVATPAVVKPDSQAASDAKAGDSKKAITEPKEEKLDKEGNPKLAKYRLLPGRVHWFEGKKVKPGETVELSEKQAYAFRDKFEKA